MIESSKNMSPESAKENSSTNPFLARAIENWLAKTNELGYQLPFCQLLLSEGHSVVHVSRHNAFEQGKDLISFDAAGELCAFQLKGGNITVAGWRKEILAEVEELINYSVVHPSVAPGTRHKSFLVTNGNLEDTVRVGIDNLNRGKWAANPLTVVTGGELRARFLVASHDYAPLEVADYGRFLEMFLADGKELVNEKKFCEFLTTTIQLETQSLSREERRRGILTAVLLSSYLLSLYFREGNHISIIRAITLIAAHVFAVVDRYGLEEKYWRDSFALLWRQIKESGQDLQEEIASDGLISMITDVWDGEIGPFRKSLATSHLLAFKLAQLLEGDPAWDQLFSKDLLEKLRASLLPWGESGLFPFILYHWLLKDQSKAVPADSVTGLLLSALDEVIRCNGRKSEAGLLSPYYGIETAVRMIYGQLEQPIDESFAGRSFLIHPLVDLLCRRGCRSQLEERWREITHIQHVSFVPAEPWMTYLWHCDQGREVSAFFQQTQSWSALQAETSTLDLALVPASLQTHAYFLPLFLLVLPQRINSNLIRFLDSAVLTAPTSLASATATSKWTTPSPTT